MHKQQNCIPPKSTARSVRTAKVFLVIKVPLEVRKQQKYSSFLKHRAKCTDNDCISRFSKKHCEKWTKTFKLGMVFLKPFGLEGRGGIYQFISTFFGGIYKQFPKVMPVYSVSIECRIKSGKNRRTCRNTEYT